MLKMMGGQRYFIQSPTKVLSMPNQIPTKPLAERLPFFHVSRLSTHFQNPRIMSVDDRQLVRLRLWSLRPDQDHFQVELVLGRPGEGPPNLKSVPRALASPFPPSLLLRRDYPRQCLTRTCYFVGEMAVCQSHLTNSLSILCRMLNHSTPHRVVTHCCRLLSI